MPDQDGEYLAAWALRNMDSTSARRMHVPAKLFNRLCGDLKVRIVDRQQLDAWRPYFSFREASMLRRLALIPFCIEGEVMAVVLIVESPYGAAQTGALESIVAAIYEQARQVLLHNHEARVRAAFNRVLTTQAEIVRYIAAQLEAGGARSITVVSIDVKRIAEALHGANPDADLFRLRQDLLRIVGSMVEDTATAGLLDSGRICLILQPELPLGADLLVHQLQTGLHDLFQESRAPIALVPRYASVKRDVDSIEEILLTL